MPRGLMIKRRKGASAVSYRERTEKQPLHGLSSLFLVTPPTLAQTPLRAPPVQFGNLEAVHALHSPTRPMSREHEHRFCPMTPEVLAARATLPEPEPGLAPQITSTRTGSGTRRALEQKTPVRRFQVRGDITMSPVVGLRIREASSDTQVHAPMAGLTCALCCKKFPEPLALAQHRCSRILRVEYRCDCGKTFSCSANLASHRRWHRPPARAHSDPDSAKDASHLCVRCGKRFKTVASLRKHEARHKDAAAVNLSACHRGVRGHDPVFTRGLST